MLNVSQKMSHLKRMHDSSVLDKYENYIVDARNSKKPKIEISYNTNYKNKMKYSQNPKKLRLTNSEHLIYCKLIRASLIQSIERRFSNILDLNTIESYNAAIVAFSHPKFKKKWLNYINISFRDKLLSIFKKAVTAEFETTTSGEDFEIEEDYFDFFDFGPMTQNDRTDTSTYAGIEVCM